MTGIDTTAEFSEIAAWGLIAATVVYGLGATRLTQGGALALAALAALLTKAALLPMT